MSESAKIDKSFERVIVPVDGSELSKKAAKIGCFLAKNADKKIVFIHVIEIPATSFPPGEQPYMPKITDEIREIGKALLQDYKNLCADKSVSIHTEMPEGIPYQEIIDFANKEDLIILGSKGHSTFERVLIGSVSEKVLHHSESSVMIVR
ncbi:MAG: universal stress protein [Candidatus Thermoplasmatota archaeon]|nr:universal stress protein [Candidatus Thermoplasmatota archaeon]